MNSSTKSHRAVWLKRMHTWHWISSAIALAGILFFSVTGLTLNHAESFEASKQAYATQKKDMPAPVVETLKADIARNGEGEAEPSPLLRDWIRQNFGVETRNKKADWKSDEIQVSLERPGGDAWLKLDLARSVAEYHVSDAGWIAYFNDLHKGRHTGRAWAWFLDVLAIACVAFAVTGFVILKMHAHHRRLTWPLVGLGLLVPALVAALISH